MLQKAAINTDVKTMSDSGTDVSSLQSGQEVDLCSSAVSQEKTENKQRRKRESEIIKTVLLK